MSRVNLWVYVIATVSSFANIFFASDFYSKTGWACSFVWSLSALMLQIRVNELEDEKTSLYIEKEVNSVKEENDEK